MNAPRMRRLGLAALMIAALVSAWRFTERESPPIQATRSDDEAILSFLKSDLKRGEKITALLTRIRNLPLEQQAPMLDTLASLRPIEAAPELAEMLRQSRDPALAVTLLRTLRAATLATSSENRIDLSDARLASAFELIQSVFRAELSRTDNDPDRLRTAVAAIADVFPADEANAIFKSLAERKLPPVNETELFGYWLEFSVGDVDGRDFQQISEFIRGHPQSVADERVKARVLEQLTITPIRPHESAKIAPLIEQLAPKEAPDDSFVRWLEVRSRLTGTAADLSALWKSASPMRKAALIHFGNPGPIDPATARGLKAELTAAAEALEDSEERDFLQDAADAISLGLGKQAP